jgi:RNA polymerase sigma factor (TIGR02999 family)
MSDPDSVTGLLQRWQQGDEAALNRLAPMVYQTLRRLAARYLRGEAANHTWQPTDLVHEAFLQIAHADVAFNDRAHFLAVAARQMRHLLVDHARAKQRAKRGGGLANVTFDEALLPVPPQASAEAGEQDLLDLDVALGRLAEQDPRKAEILELHMFAGMTYEESAHVLNLSVSTVTRDLRFAKAWLYNEIQAQRDARDAPLT